jgi:hypothetical protein
MRFTGAAALAALLTLAACAAEKPPLTPYPLYGITCEPAGDQLICLARPLARQPLP